MNHPVLNEVGNMSKPSEKELTPNDSQNPKYIQNSVLRGKLEDRLQKSKLLRESSSNYSNYDSKSNNHSNTTHQNPFNNLHLRDSYAKHELRSSPVENNIQSPHISTVFP